jgi:hypothetical protein
MPGRAVLVSSSCSIWISAAALLPLRPQQCVLHVALLVTGILSGRGSQNVRMKRSPDFSITRRDATFTVIVCT